MTSQLPRVTYSNVGADFSGVHDLLDMKIQQEAATLLGKKWGNIIGARNDDPDGKLFKVVSPLDHDILIGEFTEASPGAVGRAIEAADAAFKTWSKTPLGDRLKLMRRWGEELQRRKHDIAIAALFEVGKSRMEAAGEAEEALDLVEYYALQMEENVGFRKPLNQVLKGETTESVMLPLGVFGVIAPFNFPVALVVNMIAAAIVTGNTVVLKPSPYCGLTARLVADCACSAGIPAGVLNLVVGGDAVGEALVNASRIAGLVFTGSNRVGMSIFHRLNQGRFAKPVIAEMGGKNPAYVTSNADLSVAAEGVARSAFGLQGQKCSSCSVAYVDKKIRNDFVAQLVDFAGKLSLGDPRLRSTFMGPVYNAASYQRFQTAVQDSHRDGKILTGGGRLSGDIYDRGYYVQPTVVEFSSSHRLTREELFLPFVAIRAVDGLDAAIMEGNDVEYGLAAGVYSKDKSEIDRFLASAEAGVLYANRRSGATTGAWPGVQSFCGWKGSGVSHKGGLGPNFLPQFMREQSRTLMS